VSPRARTIVLLGAALACGGLAASAIGRERDAVRSQVGDPVPVVIAASPLRAGTLLTGRRVGRSLLRRRVPARFVPGGAIARPEHATGLRLASPLAAGDYLTHGVLRSDSARDGVSVGAPDRGRVVEVAVAGARSITSLLAPGTAVDVLVTTEKGAGAGGTRLALQRVELVGFEPGDGGGPAESTAATGTATLAVTLRQAVYLTAAQAFAREIRLVPRRHGDLRTVRGAATSASEVGR
jgi:pilus assembly protein CpaB